MLMSPRWNRSRSGVVNDVAIAYGLAPEGGEQPVTTASSAPSIAKFGRVAYSVTTQLATLADASAMATLLTTRNAEPVWLLDGIGLDLSVLDPAKQAAVLGLDIHDLINVTGFPVGGPATSAALWVEGWTEDIAHGSHVIALAVSGYCRTSPPPRWDDVAPTRTWNTVPDTWTWDNVYCIGPSLSFGRWSDVPASFRWDQLAPTVTWDTWPY